MLMKLLFWGELLVEEMMKFVKTTCWLLLIKIKKEEFYLWK